MTTLVALTAYSGVVPNRATQDDDTRALAVFDFLQYAGGSLVTDINTNFVSKLNALVGEIGTTAEQVEINKNTVVEKEALINPHYTAIDTVVANIVPNMAEILQADTNATTATTKASEASASALAAANSQAEAELSASIAIGAVNYKGDWVAGYNTTGYGLGMSVSYTDGYNYISKIDNNLIEPTTLTNTAQWDFVEAIDPTSLYTKTQTDSLLSAKAPLASPTFTGTPLSTTAAVGTNTTQIATTAYVLANTENTLTSTSTSKALSAAQGKVLQDGKQATLTSGINIKTIDGTSILGSGNIVVGDGRLKSMRVFTSSGTWTKPAGITKIKVTVVGGGGGGSDGVSNGSGGSGGAGGASIKLITDLSSITSVSVIVGGGGTYGGAYNNNGTNGGYSQFSTSIPVKATGGAGGTGDGSFNVAQGGVGTGGDYVFVGGHGQSPAAIASQLGTRGGVKLFLVEVGLLDFFHNP